MQWNHYFSFLRLSWLLFIFLSISIFSTLYSLYPVASVIIMDEVTWSKFVPSREVCDFHGLPKAMREIAANRIALGTYSGQTFYPRRLLEFIGYFSFLPLWNSAENAIFINITLFTPLYIYDILYILSSAESLSPGQKLYFTFIYSKKKYHKSIVWE